MEALVDDNELAKILKIPKSTIHFYTRVRGMPYLKVGKHKRFNPHKVIKWFEGIKG